MTYSIRRSFLSSCHLQCPRLLFAIFVVAVVSITVPVSADGAEQELLQARFQEIVPWLPGGFLPLEQVTAWEENSHFVYLVAQRLRPRQTPIGDAEGDAYVRLLFLRPATLVVDAFPFARQNIDATRPSTMAAVEVESASGIRSKRRVCAYAAPNVDATCRTASITVNNNICNAQIMTGGRQFRLTLPTDLNATATISVKSSDGAEILQHRQLPAGIMPSGPDGMRLIERWDSSYRGTARPGWDKGSPSSHLKAAIQNSTVKPGRAIVLGCGTGTNAIYLASKGFDVTALDIAPAALRLAEDKARQANVQVRWLLCDVLAPPTHLEPFDLIFDRGCYHGVRRIDAQAYVKTVKRLSRPGTQLLILAGNANEDEHYGPPRVTEEELRKDFAPSFEFVRLRTVRFDSADADQQGALAWFALLRRKVDTGR